MEIFTAILWALLCITIILCIYLFISTITYIFLFDINPNDAFELALNELKFWKISK
jgi:TM2 domain-containing membrane protein YozV